MDVLVNKLKGLKLKVIKWETIRKHEMKKELIKIENEVDLIYANHPPGILSAVDKFKILDLDGKKLDILRKEEIMW